MKKGCRGTASVSFFPTQNVQQINVIFFYFIFFFTPFAKQLIIIKRLTGESPGGYISPRQNKLAVRVFSSWVRSGEDSAKNAAEARDAER